MLVKGKPFRTIWLSDNKENTVSIIDQTRLPYEFVIKDINNYKDMAKAIKDMEVRGAGLIGAAGAFAMYLAVINDKSHINFLEEIAQEIKETRPTAVNLEWAVNRMLKCINTVSTYTEKCAKALSEAQLIADEDAEFGRKIGEAGLTLIEELSKKKKGDTVHILTHCNAGWLALVDYGTALAPIYAAHKNGLKVHVWVDETRPRNQGAFLTAWELAMADIPHTVITDNAGGILMQKGFVDMVIVGSDRTTYTGDVCNKIGTYLKALAAKDNNVPFYVAVYSSSIDWYTADGLKDIPIEERSDDEIRFIKGLDSNNSITEVCILPTSSPASNFAFDVTPARLVTALITERGICKPHDILNLFPEKKNI